MARKKKNLNINTDDLSYEEPIDEVCFTDYVEPTGDFISLFSVNNETTNKDVATNKSELSPKENIPLPSDNTLFDNRKGKSTANGLTPPINGEYFNIKRGYCMRRSTIVMLNELKASHPDINVYMNSIVDAAISHYYNFITKEGGSQLDSSL